MTKERVLAALDKPRSLSMLVSMIGPGGMVAVQTNGALRGFTVTGLSWSNVVAVKRGLVSIVFVRGDDNARRGPTMERGRPLIGLGLAARGRTPTDAGEIGNR